jgi:hypothetical protein
MVNKFTKAVKNRTSGITSNNITKSDENVDEKNPIQPQRELIEPEVHKENEVGTLGNTDSPAHNSIDLSIQDSSEQSNAQIQTINEPVNKAISILDNIVPEVKSEPAGRNKSVYFPKEVLEAIEKTAKAKKVTANKLIVSILRQVLINE